MMEERNILAPLHQVEKLAIQATSQSIQSFREAFDGELPKAVYPEIRAITADKPTRNKTYYPLENLRPNEEGTRGIITYLYPYPKPILYQHDADSTKAEVFGRAKYVAMANEGGVNYVSLIPEITDPYAIQKVMDGRFLTVSIGSETDWVKCSICGCNRHEDYCDHTRGLSYKLKDGNIDECVWHMGPMVFEELSFVISPSDTDARVLRVHTDLKKVPLLKAEALDLKSHYLESKKKSWNFAVKESARILESVHTTLEDTEPEEDDEDEVVTLGSLYDLEEDDPDFNTPADDYESMEAKLSAAQRKALPASSYCGPGRSFPANDACLVGSQMVPLLDGRTVRMDEIPDLLEVEGILWAYSFDIQSHSIKPGRIVWAAKTISNAETLEIELDNGEVITCTGNHPFLTKGCEYIPAEELQVGDSIMPLYRKKEGQFQHRKPYTVVLQPWYGFWEPAHRLVARSVLGRPLESDEIVHHKDEVTGNNAPPNLEVMTRSQHILHHKQSGDSAERKPVTYRESEVEARSNFTRNRMKAILEDPELSAAHSEKLSRGRRLYDWTHPESLIGDTGLNLYDIAELITAGVDVSYLADLCGVDFTTVRRWVEKADLPAESPNKRTSDVARAALLDFSKKVFGVDFLEIHADLCAGVKYTELQRKYKIDRFTIKCWFQRLGLESDRHLATLSSKGESWETLYNAWRAGEISKARIISEYGVSGGNLNKIFDSLELEIPVNHKVVAIRVGPIADVYDIEVEEYHNFALDAGVFVHNSHARVGLSMLSRSKAPNKDRIRACLQRKLAKFNDKNSCLAILTDSKLLVEFPVLSVNPGNAVELGTLLEELGLPLKYKGDLRRRLAYLCKVEKCARPKSISEAYDSLGDEEVAPVVIEMDGENYPILYTVIEALTASNLREERNMGDTTIDETIQTTEEQTLVTTESVDITSEAGNPVNIEEARAEELTALLVQEKAVAKGYRAETAAVLAIVMRKPIARGKEFSVLANELAARSSESLNDMVKDYLLELEGAPTTEAVTPVENPTITFAEDSGNVLGNSLVSQIEVSDGTDDDDPAKSLEFLKKYSKV